MASKFPTCRPERFTEFRQGQTGAALARRLIPVADRVRDLHTRFGLRTYRVRVIRTRWTGDRRGEGQEILLSEVPILPTPLISDISGLTLVATSAAFDEQGQLVLSEVSGVYTEDELLGRSKEGERPGLNEQVFYEIERPAPAERRRFSMRSAPYYNSARFQWFINLVRASDGRDRITGALR